MRARTVPFGLMGVAFTAPCPAAWGDPDRGSPIPLEAMTFEEIASARAAGTGCTWLGGPGLTRRVAMKEDRGAVKRGGRIVTLRPSGGASEVFPYTFHHWIGGSMDISIKNSGKVVGRGLEHVETLATLTLVEEGRSRSWRGRLNCGS